MSNPVETQLSSRWKGSWILVVGLLGCTPANKHPLECPWYFHSQGRWEFLFLRIFTITDFTSKAGCLKANNWLCVGQFFIWQCETISWVLEGSCEKGFVCNCFMIHAYYTIEDSGFLSCKLSLGNYLCCVWLIFLHVHVISDCVFNSTKYL